MDQKQKQKIIDKFIERLEIIIEDTGWGDINCKIQSDNERVIWSGGENEIQKI